MQRVTFPSFPKVDGDKCIHVTIQIFNKIKAEELTDKQLKRWMRTQGWYEKETYEEMLSFIGVKVAGKGEPVTLAPKALELMNESNAEKRQDIVFARLAGYNEILAKYVFDAIQERLYSTNELFRMLTSYVYPGKVIGMADFNGWLKWMQSTERIRVLGIRWALGQRFSASQNYITGIDVDELLEEDAEEDLLDDDEDEVVAPPPPAKVEEPADDSGWEPPEDDIIEDDIPGGIPAASPLAAVAAPVAAAAGQDLSGLVAALSQMSAPASRAPELIDARLLEPAPHLSALAAGVPLQRVRAAMEGEGKPEEWLTSLEPSEEATAENVKTLLEWWSGVEDRPLVRADQHGLMPFGLGGWEPGSRAKFLFRLACLGVSLLRDDSHGTSFAVLDKTGFYDKLFDEAGSVERLMDELFEQGLGGRPDLFANLHLELMLARSLRGAESWCESLAELDADEVYAQTWKRLAAYNLNLEVCWIVRELSMFGLLRQEGLRQYRVIPTAEVRKAAFHLGLLDSPRADSLGSMLYVSKCLTELTGSALEGPLMTFWRTYGAHPPRRFWSR